MLDVVVQLTPWTSLRRASKVLTGLCGLERQGQIRLRLKPTAADSGEEALVIMDVSDGPIQHRVVLDLLDSGNEFQYHRLQDCDWYFKRSYDPSAVAALPGLLRDRVVPLGLNYACRGYGVTTKLVLSIARLNAAIGLGSIPGPRASIRERLSEVRALLTTPHVREFEVQPADIVRPVVLYQTRVWEPHELPPDDAGRINQQRVAVIQALRRAFGNQFVGGLVPTPLARREYPEFLTNWPTRKCQYVAMSRETLIAVYTRGLYGSTGFKLPEYLAGSKAIVAEGIRFETPAPLVEGTHYLAFREPEECIEHCARLLRDRDLAAELRRAAHAHYCSEVEPVAHMRKLLAVCAADLPTPDATPATLAPSP